MVQCIKPADAHSPVPSLVGVGGVHQVMSDLGPRSASPQATQQCLTKYLVIYKVLKVPTVDSHLTGMAAWSIPPTQPFSELPRKQKHL
jgi:hypothetical protein